MKREFVILAVLVWLACSGRSNAQPVFKLRLYDLQAKYLVDNLAVSQLHKKDTVYAMMEVYLLHNRGLPSMQARIAQLRDFGFRTVPGMRLAEKPTFEVAEWVSAVHWTKKAAELTAVAKLRTKQDPRVYIDAENYGTHAEATAAILEPLGGPKALIAAMQPFLEVIRTQDIVPCMTPGNLDDVVEQLCAEASRRSEFLEESTFGDEREIRLGGIEETLPHLLNAQKRRLAVMTKFPTARWTPGFSDELLRDWGARFRSDFRHGYGEKSCWLYLLEREDETRLGTAEWLDGRSLSSLNDCLFFTGVAPAGWEEWNRRATLAEWWIAPSGDEVVAAHAPTRPVDMFPGGYWPVDNRYVKDSSLKLAHTTNSFAIAMDVLLTNSDPASLCGVWYAKQAGGESWQVRHDAGKWVFDYLDAQRKIHWSALSVPAKPKIWQRVFVSFNGAKVVLLCDDTAAALACTPRDYTTEFTVGLGGLNGKPLFADSLRFRNFHLWKRALSDADLKTVKGSAKYPFKPLVLKRVPETQPKNDLPSESTRKR